MASANAPVPVVPGGLYRLIATGAYQEDGSLAVSLHLHHAGEVYTVSRTIPEPRSGTLFGIGGRAQPQETPSYLFHRFAVTLGSVPGAIGHASFEAWKRQHFAPAEWDDSLVAGSGADPAGDGMANLLKYAFDLSPWATVTLGEMVALERVDGDLFVRYEVRIDAMEVELEPEVSTNLVTWLSGREHFEEVARVPARENTELVTLRVVGSPEATSGFLRLRVIWR
jgi:hypothetical protein